jgi:hypothetical protein
MAFSFSADETLEEVDHNVDQDKGAVERDDHVEGKLDVVSAPLSLFSSLLNSVDSLYGLSL